MIENTLFNIPMWSIPTLNFKKKKPQLEKLCKAFPEKKHGMQPFSTNRQRDRSGFADAFNNIMSEELGMLSQKLKKDIQLQDIWSVSYKKGDYHTPHNHGSLGLTGILYLNMPKDAYPTTYIQPWNDWYSDRTIYNPLKVNEGDIVVIPRFIKHFTKPHISKQIKRVISWDMNIL